MPPSSKIIQELGNVQRLIPLQVQITRMLEMSSVEVENEVRCKLEENPALEVVTDTEESDEINVGQSPDGEDVSPDDSYDDADRDHEDYDYRQYNGTAHDGSFIFKNATDADSLIDNLEQQLSEMNIDDATRKLAKYIIGNLDDNGYMTRTINAMINDFAITYGYEISREQMQRAFDVVRQLEPAGIGAVDLRDCLLLQLNRLAEEQASMTDRRRRALRIATEIIRDYYDMFEKRHHDRIRQQLRPADARYADDALELIRHLDPKPGRGLANDGATDKPQYITPDFLVKESEDGTLVVSFESHYPQLQVAQSYELANNKSVRSKQEYQYIKECRKDAQSFIGLLKIRRDTLMQVISAIVQLQPDFFRSGHDADIKPMRLKDIAAITHQDLSVISRAIDGKYVGTPYGTFLLRKFLNTKVNEDDDTSSHEIMDAIKEIIASENPSKPLSDDALTKLLNERGYRLARRTVTKYREKMGIPVSRLRRQR